MKLIILAVVFAVANAACPHSCSGHGKCDMFDICKCYTAGGMNGHLEEALQWSGPDCSLKTCPRGISHTNALPYAAYEPGDHAKHAPNAICSDRGHCNHQTGECECLEGWTGSSCQNSACAPGTKNGVCVSNQQLAQEASELASKVASAADYADKTDSELATIVADLAAAAVAAGTEAAEAEHEAFLADLEDDMSARVDKLQVAKYDDAWDSGLQYGALCDIGFRGLSCELIECPSMPDPLELSDGAPNGRECSGRGLCNYQTGICECFNDYTGNACQQINSMY